MEILLNVSVRKNDHKSIHCETIIVRDVSVKYVEEITDEIVDQIWDAVTLCLDELGLTEDE